MNTELIEVENPRTAAGSKPPKGVLSGWLRRLHWYVAAGGTVLFLLIFLTGWLISHREAFGLNEIIIGRTWLPADYRPDDPDGGVRADIVITDLHSGRIFGPNGRFFIDIAVAAWMLLLASGYGVKLLNCRGVSKKTDKET